MPYLIEFGYDILHYDEHWLVLLKYLDQYVFYNRLSLSFMKKLSFNINVLNGNFLMCGL